jgi:hypothetical protein
MANNLMNLCLSLINNIQNGDIDKAVKNASDLVKLKQMIKLVPNSLISSEEKWNTEYCMETGVTVQDSEQEITINYHISRLATIEELKTKVH